MPIGFEKTSGLLEPRASVVAATLLLACGNGVVDHRARCEMSDACKTPNATQPEDTPETPGDALRRVDDATPSATDSPKATPTARIDGPNEIDGGFLPADDASQNQPADEEPNALVSAALLEPGMHVLEHADPLYGVFRYHVRVTGEPVGFGRFLGGAPEASPADHALFPFLVLDGSRAVELIKIEYHEDGSLSPTRYGKNLWLMYAPGERLDSQGLVPGAGQYDETFASDGNVSTTIQPGDTIVTAVRFPEAGVVRTSGRSSSHAHLKSLSTLTVLNTSPPTDAIAPAYLDSAQSIHEVQWGRIPGATATGFSRDASMFEEGRTVQWEFAHDVFAHSGPGYGWAGRNVHWASYHAYEAQTCAVGLWLMLLNHPEVEQADFKRFVVRFLTTQHSNMFMATVYRSHSGNPAVLAPAVAHLLGYPFVPTVTTTREDDKLYFEEGGSDTQPVNGTLTGMPVGWSKKSARPLFSTPPHQWESDLEGKDTKYFQIDLAEIAAFVSAGDMLNVLDDLPESLRIRIEVFGAFRWQASFGTGRDAWTDTEFMKDVKAHRPESYQYLLPKGVMNTYYPGAIGVDLDAVLHAAEHQASEQSAPSTLSRSLRGSWR